MPRMLIYFIFLLFLSIGRAASQDLRNRKRHYEMDLLEKRIALDLESAALDAREVRTHKIYIYIFLF